MKTYHRVDSQISVMCGKWERNLWLLYIENFTRIQIDIYIYRYTLGDNRIGSGSSKET